MSFSKIESRELTDIQSQAHLYRHDETGAQVLFLQNEDKNKAFTIGFKTPPYDDNGIAHILEHSVLNGSEKFPSKEPFVEIVKGSMSTFINAMTFADKTIYPVASTNNQDFKNLVSVYLDAVFEPNFRRDPQILAQEGWHYHLENSEDDLIYKGVVYNEMKGATASPEDQIYYNITKNLYADSIYQYESGGLPSAIPSLTQDAFVDFFQRYYHPSNSFTVVYGDVEVESVFNQLEEYFEGKGAFAEPVDLSFEKQLPEKHDFESTYSITEGDDPSDKDYLALAWHVSTAGDLLDNNGLEVLEEILFGNQQSPLKKALLEAEIGGDINGGVDHPGYPNMFVITAKYSSADKMSQFKEIVRKTLIQLVEEGIDPELVQASINKMAFEMKESVISESNPRGVIYAISAYRTWLYDEDPYAAFEFSKYLNQLEELAKEGYFEKLIQEKLLNNDDYVALTLIAEPGKNDRIEADLHKELQDFKAQLPEEEIELLVADTQRLITRQEAPDTAEDLAKIPLLRKEDLTTEVEQIALDVQSLASDFGQFYVANQFTSGIDYVDLYWNIEDLSMDQYSALALLGHLLGKLATEQYGIDQLQRQIDLYTGGIKAGIKTFKDQDDQIKPYFVISGKALEESFDKLISLMHEIMTASLFDNQKDILRVIHKLISNFEMTVAYGAHSLASNRALSHWKAEMKLNELIAGIDFFNYLKEERKNLQNQEATSLYKTLEDLKQLLLNKERLNVFYIGDAKRSEQIKSNVLQLFDHLPKQALGSKVKYQAGQRQNEAFMTAQDVNYVGLASDAEGKVDYNGHSIVLANEIRYGYLWNEVRVKGGAYGAMYRHSRTGQLSFASYRDPNIAKTIETYLSTPEFIQQLKLNETELLKDIIGSLSPLEQPRSARDKGIMALTMHLVGLTREDIIRDKEEIIATTVNDLTSFAPDYRHLLEETSLAVIGNKAQIEREKDRFDVIYELY